MRKQRHRAMLVDVAGNVVTIGCRVKVLWPKEKESFFGVFFGRVERVLPDHPQWDGGAIEVLCDDEELYVHPTSGTAGVLTVVDDDCCAMPQLGISIRTVCMDDPIKLQLNEPFGCPKTSRVLFTANGNKTYRDNTLRLRGKFSSSLAADLDAALAACKNHVKVRIVAARLGVVFWSTPVYRFIIFLVHHFQNDSSIGWGVDNCPHLYDSPFPREKRRNNRRGE
jgi:hypothetical protein